MKGLEDYHSIQCPYCFSAVRIMIDYSGGVQQSFTYDCEVCCKPILIKAEIRNGRLLSLNAEPDN